MGMFDWVKLDDDLPCPTCGAMIPRDQWQTKDSKCYLDVIPQALLLIYGVHRFYSGCPNGHYVEFEVNQPFPDQRDPVPGYHIKE